MEIKKGNILKGLIIRATGALFWMVAWVIICAVMWFCTWVAQKTKPIEEWNDHWANGLGFIYFLAFLWVLVKIFPPKPGDNN